MTLTIRARLTLWYTLILSLVLAISATAFYFVQARARVAQRDEELSRASALVARLVPNELDEGLGIAEAAYEALEDIQMPGRRLAIFDAGGFPLRGPWENLPRMNAAALGDRGVASSTVATADGGFRVHLARYRHKDTTYQVGVAEASEPLDRELAALRHALLGSASFALLLAVAGGWWIARAALKPVEMMAEQARRISDRTPGFRLASSNQRDELALLARAFNDLLARIEAALSQQRQFMADASHELRTPVSIARTAIEVTLGREERPEGEYRDALVVLREQVARLSRLIEDMFTLARADVARLPLDRKLLYLNELVADCVKGATVLAAAKGVSLEWRGGDDLEVSGDERLLREMLMNLLDNAIRHTPTGGAVAVGLVTKGDVVEVSVTDRGGGIREADRERVFERFVRLDSASGGDGAGLGLPIARAVAEAHGGVLLLLRSDAVGSTFAARLPLASQNPVRS